MVDFLPNFQLDADWVSAIAASAAVIVALLGKRIEEFWQGTAALTATAEAPTMVTDGRVFAYLRIMNTGKRTAEKAEVSVKAVQHLSPAGAGLPLAGFVPMNLRWAHAEPGHPEAFVSIPSQMERRCTLGALKQYSSGRVYFELWTVTKPSPDANELDEGNYCIDLSLGGHGTSSEKQSLLLEVPGEMDPDKLKITFIKGCHAANSCW